MKILATISLFTLLLIGCNGSKSADKETEGPEKIVIPKVAANYAAIDTTEYWLTYPKSWRYEGNIGEGTEFTLYSPIDEDAFFEDNLSLGLENLPSSTVTPKEYLESAKTMIGNVIENFSITEEADVKNKYSTGRRIEYTGNIQGLDAKWKQYVFIKNSKAYVLTFTCLNTPESIKKNDAISDQIINSFILK